MKTITINIDDKYADVITFTVIGAGHPAGLNVHGGGAWGITDGMVLTQHDGIFTEENNDD